MEWATLAPGVLREDVFPQPLIVLATGVPAFIGFGPMAARRSLSRFDAADWSAWPAAAGDTPPLSYLPGVVRAFFANGGVRCELLAVPQDAPDREAALFKAIDTLEAFDDIDLIAAPDALLLRDAGGMPDRAAAVRVQQALLRHCARTGTRIALLDAWPGAGIAEVMQQRNLLLAGLAEPLDGALYHPWIRSDADALLPPCGHIAGVIAGTDAESGPHRAPANRVLADALDLATLISAARQGELNALGINCLRALPGRGLRVWGARTLSTEPEWRYLTVRRVVLTLRRWVEAHMAWAAFEPNTPLLWTRIARELNAQLLSLWRAGALLGSTPEQAFFVKCDAETNDATAREAGQLICELGLAPAAPAEFVLVRVILRSGMA